MRRLLLVLAALPLLGIGEGLGEWRPPNADGESPGFVYAQRFLPGSSTCGIQEAIDAATGGQIIYLPQDSTCTNITTPIHITGTRSLIFQGAGAGHVDVLGTGTRLHADFDAIEESGTGTITIDSDVFSSVTIDLVNDGSSGTNGTFTINCTGCAFNTDVNNAMEVGQYLRIENLTDSQSGVNEDNNNLFPIISITDDDTIVVGDPKGRVDADSSGTGDERLWGTIIECTAGDCDTDWGDVSPIDTDGTSAGDVPMFVRFRTAAADANTCPFGGSCDSNGREWPILAELSGGKLAVDDVKEIAASQAGVAVDYVVSPSLWYAAESALGPETASTQARHIHFRDFTVIGDGDGDGDGDAFAAFVFRPDNDHSGSQKNITWTQVQIETFGNGDATVSGIDFSYLDTGIWIMGQQRLDGQPAGTTNDQYDDSLIDGVVFVDNSRCLYLNSIQSPQVTVRDGGECTTYGYRGMELESGILSVIGQAGTTDSTQLHAPEAKYYVHEFAQGIRIERDYWEGGVGAFIVTESGYSGATTISHSRLYLQDQDREDFLSHQGDGVLVLAFNTFERANAAYEADIEAPNAAKIVEIGSRCVETTGAPVTCADGASNIIENRNYGVLPDPGFCVSTLIDAPVDADDSYVFHAERALHVFSADCIIKGTTSIAATLQECGSDGGSCGTTEAAITCDADGAAQSGAIDDYVVDAGDWMHLALAAPTDAPTSLTYEFCGYYP
jgi:hypothetical protein